MPAAGEFREETVFAMCDIFKKQDLLRVFGNKSVLFLGDSIMRSLYKDFVWLSRNDELIPPKLNKEVCTPNKLQ